MNAAICRTPASSYSASARWRCSPITQSTAYRLGVCEQSAALRAKPDRLGAEDLVSVKTYIVEIGHGLVEFIAISAVVKKTAGVSVTTPTLPVLAIVPDKDTWIDGHFGFQLDPAN